MRRAALALCCVLVLQACDGSDADGAGTTGAAPPPTTAASTTTAAPPVVPIGVPPCDLVGADDVATAIGSDVAPGRAEPPLACVFDLQDDGGVHVAVIVEDGEGRMGGAAAIFRGYLDLVAEGGAEEVPGLGVGAIYSQSFRGLAVDAGGGRYLAFVVGGGFQALEQPKAELAAIALAALARL